MFKANPATKAEAEVVTPIQPISALQANEMWVREAGVKVNTYEIVPREDTPIEHLTQPEFWANVAAKLIPFSTVIVVPSDGTFYAEMVVRAAGRNWAQLVFKNGYPMIFEEAPRSDARDDHLEVFHHPSRGWIVRHKETLRVYKDHLPNEDDAIRVKADYYRVIR